MAKKITEITRRAILEDLLASEIRLYGILEELDFLPRVWDLTAMHSTDARFDNAAGDIWQHRVNNSDWEDSWLFYDSRLALMSGEDEIFMRFLSEIVHPDVRPDAAEASYLCALCNQRLRRDGYELVEAGQINAMPFYASSCATMTDIDAQMVLTGLARSVYTRIVRLVLAEAKLDYVFEEIDIFSASGVPEHYLKKHPFARIPAFRHGGFSLYETSAITRYIDDVSATSLQPAAPAVRARMNQVIGIIDAYAYRAMVWDVFVQRVVNPIHDKSSDESVIAAALPLIENCLQALDTILGRQHYFCGPQLTLADLHAVPVLHYFSLTPEGAQMITARKSLAGWLRRMQLRPSMLATKAVYES